MCPPISHDYRDYVKLKDKDGNELCIICGEPVLVMCMKGTGVCGELHRKVRDGEPTDQPLRISSR